MDAPSCHFCPFFLLLERVEPMEMKTNFTIRSIKEDSYKDDDRTNMESDLGARLHGNINNN